MSLFFSLGVILGALLVSSPRRSQLRSRKNYRNSVNTSRAYLCRMRWWMWTMKTAIELWRIVSQRGLTPLPKTSCVVEGGNFDWNIQDADGNIKFQSMATKTVCHGRRGRRGLKKKWML